MPYLEIVAIDIVDDYLARYGPKSIRKKASTPLFANTDGTPVTDAALADGIRKATARGVGVTVTPNQFRHICATLLLDAFPGEYTTVKDLLGHRFLETTLAFYGGQEREAAGVQWNALLEKQRGQLATPRVPYAQAA